MNAKDIFNLVNYNDGKFKSEAQSKFFNDVAYGNEITVDGGQIFKSRWNWIVIIDSVGIVEVYKNTNKKRTLFWSRETNEQYKKDKASRLSKVTQEDIDFIKKDILMYENLIAEDQAVLDKFDEIKASREIPDFMKETVNERYALTSERILNYTKQKAERISTLHKFEERLKTVHA
ncbi:thioredoxin [Escherichia phage moha]|uniref:Thioredoxin n=1 Tax=Escherichia phage moha TaxID=2696423 RepID=A0A6B9WWR6_9CAUD|nr:thioredoxin [Escherichia phage moha]